MPIGRRLRGEIAGVDWMLMILDPGANTLALECTSETIKASLVFFQKEE